MSTSDYKMEIDNPTKEKAIKTAVNDMSSDMEAMSKDLSSINEQLPALVATRSEINDFKNKVETYDKKLAEATAVINNGVDVRVDPAKLSGEDVQMLENLRSKLDRWNQRWENLWKAIANTGKIKIYLTGILSSALSVCITLLICYDSSYIWAHRAFIASEAKYDDNPGAEYSKTFIDMKGGKTDRKRAKEHVEGLESSAEYIEFHEQILSNYIDEEFELRESKVRIKDEQMIWVICYHPSTDKMINYRVHTAPDGLVLKVEQELTKQSKRVGWKELPRLTPENETDAT